MDGIVFFHILAICLTKLLAQYVSNDKPWLNYSPELLGLKHLWNQSFLISPICWYLACFQSTRSLPSFPVCSIRNSQSSFKRPGLVALSRPRLLWVCGAGRAAHGRGDLSPMMVDANGSLLSCDIACCICVFQLWIASCPQLLLSRLAWKALRTQKDQLRSVQQVQQSKINWGGAAGSAVQDQLRCVQQIQH